MNITAISTYLITRSHKLASVTIVDLNRKGLGPWYCQLVDTESGEALLSSTLQYAVDYAERRGWLIANATEVLHSTMEVVNG